MFIDFLIERFEKNKDLAAIIYREEEYTYSWLLDKIKYYRTILDKESIEQYSVVALRSDFNPESVALMLALIGNGNCFVPISYAVKNEEEFYEIAEVDYVLEFIDNELVKKERNVRHNHQILASLKERKSPGLILFSSGSTGKSKAAVHDFVPLLEKFKTERKALKTITFLLFDHIGGVNTLLYILSNAGTIVAVEDRSPENICRLIEKYKVELLPTSPTFISMILISKAYIKYDITSLKMATYGTEAMPESTLKSFHKLFPTITLKQTYGLSELGILRSKSRSNDSLWVKVGGEDYDIKIIDDILYIKAKSAMLGYLNAPSPFDEEGWFNTQDKVETDGEWIKILGRETDIINVGGQKVYPAEVESVLGEIDNIESASVFGVENALVGNVVGAKVSLTEPEDLKSLKKRIRSYCKERLESFKIPVHIEIVERALVSSRFKKIR
ncbi:long-chain fatty acid--CoA ligase [bacterium]|nr:MAG: long-chain fatty acid--CoA ligase [bacterium]